VGATSAKPKPKPKPGSRADDGTGGGGAREAGCRSQGFDPMAGVTVHA
jgi:hypothetical protein